MDQNRQGRFESGSCCFRAAGSCQNLDGKPRRQHDLYRVFRPVTADGLGCGEQHLVPLTAGMWVLNKAGDDWDPIQLDAAGNIING